MDALPTIDMSDLMASTESRRRPRSGDVTAQVASACRDIGFLTVTGHGIPSDLMSELSQLTAELFAQTREVKMDLHITKDNYRGYIPLNFFTPNASGQSPDSYEGYKLHTQISPEDPVCSQCSLYGPNKWPDFPSTLKQVVESYWQHCDNIAETLLHALLLELGVDSACVQSAFNQLLTNRTLLHYPPATSSTVPGQSAIGIHPHKDTASH